MSEVPLYRGTLPSYSAPPHDQHRVLARHQAYTYTRGLEGVQFLVREMQGLPQIRDRQRPQGDHRELAKDLL